LLKIIHLIWCREAKFRLITQRFTTALPHAEATFRLIAQRFTTALPHAEATFWLIAQRFTTALPHAEATFWLIAQRFTTALPHAAFGPKRDTARADARRNAKVTGDMGDCIIRKVKMCTFKEALSGRWDETRLN
jgi:hypothetical protein